MFNLIIKRRVVIYPQFAEAPAIIAAGSSAVMAIPAYTVVGLAAYAAFQLECRLRRAEIADVCLRKPNEEFLALRRAPECPTSRYCLDCPL